MDEFVFPRLGAGMFYERMAEEIESNGGKILLGKRSIGFRHEGNQVRSVLLVDDAGHHEEVEGGHFIASAPLTDSILGFDPVPPPEIRAAANDLRYRSHVGVDLLVEGNPFPDNWIYVHSRQVRLARIANYRNFSREMAPDDRLTPLTVEYFCFTGDDIWTMDEPGLIELAKTELQRMRKSFNRNKSDPVSASAVIKRIR